MITWPKIVWNSLAAAAVLFVSLVSSADAQAGYRHGGHGGGYSGGRAYSGHVRYAAPMRAVHVNPVRTAIAYTARPYTAASYAPRTYGYGGSNAGYNVRHAAPVYLKPARQVRYVQYQPTAYYQAGYSTLQQRAYAPRARCSC